MEKKSELAKSKLVNRLLKDKFEKILKKDSLKTVKLNKRYQSALKKVNEQKGKYTTEIQDIFAKLYKSNLQTNNIRDIALDKLCQDLSVLYNTIDLNAKMSDAATTLPLNISCIILPAHKARSGVFDNPFKLNTFNENSDFELLTIEPAPMKARSTIADLDKVIKVHKQVLVASPKLI